MTIKLYFPERAVFTPSSLTYELGRNIYLCLKSKGGVEIIKAHTNRVKSMIPGENLKEAYTHSKRTLLITTSRVKKLDVCRPSADWQFHLVSGCPGYCEYCYLQTTHGEKPYLKMYVNLEDIYEVIKKYIADNPDRITSFEAASLGDPLALEHISGALARTVEFFGNLQNGRLRVVTKYNNIKGLLRLKHNGHTRFRVSVNTRYIIDKYEHGTCSLDQRAEVARALLEAGYPTGFIIAPIMVYDGWKDGYRDLIDILAEKVGADAAGNDLTFELIQHRFTDSAKKLISERFPGSSLDMDETSRKLKWGKFGRFKYVYPDEISRELRDYLSGLINSRFARSRIEYFT